MHTTKWSVIVIAGLLAVAMPSAAQNRADHLTCYKVKDSLKLKGTLDIDTSQLGLSEGCKIKKAKMLCAPSHAQNIDDGSGNKISSSGPRTSTYRVCYTVNCAKPYPGSQDVTDEFGSRTLEKLKTKLVCAPATSSPPLEISGLLHRARGLAQLSEGGTPQSPTVHALSLDGSQPDDPVLGKSSLSDPGGSGVVVVLQAVSSYGMRVRDGRNSTILMDAAAMPPGAGLNLRVHGVDEGHEFDESDSDEDMESIATGSGGVSSTAYFPRLQRVQPSPARTGVVTCQGQQVGSDTETTPGDPTWTWTSTVWPDHYATSSNATTDEAVFEWDNGCVEIEPPGGGAAGVLYVGDRLVVSIDNGSSPRVFTHADITASGGLDSFTIKDEATQ